MSSELKMSSGVPILGRFERPGEPPPQGLGVPRERADGRVSELAGFELADGGTVDPSPIGDVREAQSLSFTLVPQSGQR